MKKALLTTTALVALSGAAFADSVAVRNGGTSHHTHAPTVVFHGEANIKYNIPFKKVTGGSTDGKILSDVDLDVTMTSPGTYSATVSYGLEGNVTNDNGDSTDDNSMLKGATVTVGTPLLDISVGHRDARGGGEAGADASYLYSDIDRMSSVGSEEDNSDWYIKLPNFGGWTVAASGRADQSVAGASQQTSIGLSGSVGGLSVTAGGKNDSGGISVSTSLMGATVKVAAANIKNDAGVNTQETGVSVSMPLGGMTLAVNSTTVDGTAHWGVDVSTTVSGFAISVGTDSEEENKFKITGPLGPVKLHLEYDSDDSSLTPLTVDPTIEAGVTYDVPGTKGTSISASYSNDDDDFDEGTQVKMAFKF